MAIDFGPRFAALGQVFPELVIKHVKFQYWSAERTTCWIEVAYTMGGRVLYIRAFGDDDVSAADAFVESFHERHPVQQELPL